MGIFVAMLIGISTNVAFGAFGYKIYDIRDYIVNTNYEIDATKYVLGNFTLDPLHN